MTKIRMTKAERNAYAKKIGEGITRGAYVTSITTTGTKENNNAKEALSTLKLIAKNLNEYIVDEIHKIM